MQMIINTPMNYSVRLDLDYFYKSILIKHPALRGFEKDIIHSIQSPFTIRRSTKDPNVFLFYAIFQNRMICSVIKQTPQYCFLITTYPCDSVKKGEILWQK